jgi:hypothetical protein
VKFRSKYFTPAKPGRTQEHGDHILAIKIIDYFGGYVDPEVAIHSLLAYFVGWVRWRALTGKEKYQVRVLRGIIRKGLEGEGVLDTKKPLPGDEVPR